jgi:FkbM family methyltransferase
MKPLLYTQAPSRSRSWIEALETTPSGANHRSPVFKTISRAPLLLRLARTMTRSRIRGGSRLEGILGQLGILDVIVQYRLDRDVNFSVPLFRTDTCWDRKDLEDYEKRVIHLFCRLLEPLCDVVLFDCGADIGTFSALVCSHTTQVARVIAFEPNQGVSIFVKQNLSQLNVPAEAIIKGVGCCGGTGRLETPAYDQSDHARFLVPGDGSLEVVTLEVLKGAVETIKSARKCVISMEAHPRVARRTKRDPIECLRLLESLRPFNFVIAETGEVPSASSALIEVGQKHGRNVIGWSQ